MTTKRPSFTDEEALAFHRYPQPGKLSVTPTKPMATQKDLSLALGSARKMGVSLPNTATAQELFNSCAAHGGKAWDHSAMVRALEKLANFEIGQKA